MLGFGSIGAGPQKTPPLSGEQRKADEEARRKAAPEDRGGK
jgi:hypothetical protein